MHTYPGYNYIKPTRNQNLVNLHLRWYIPQEGPCPLRSKENYYFARILCHEKKKIDFGPESRKSHVKNQFFDGVWVIFTDKDYMFLTKKALYDVGYIDIAQVPSTTLSELDYLFNTLLCTTHITPNLQLLHNRMDDVHTWTSVPEK